MNAIVIYDPLGDPYYWGCPDQLCKDCICNKDDNRCRLWRHLYNDYERIIR